MDKGAGRRATFMEKVAHIRGTSRWEFEYDFARPDYV